MKLGTKLKILGATGLAALTFGCDTTQPLAFFRPEGLLGLSMIGNAAVNPDLTPKQAAFMDAAGEVAMQSAYLEAQGENAVKAARAGRDVIIIQEGAQIYKITRVGNTITKTPIRTKRYDEGINQKEIENQPKYKITRVGNTITKTPIRYPK